MAALRGGVNLHIEKKGLGGYNKALKRKCRRGINTCRHVSIDTLSLCGHPVYYQMLLSLLLIEPFVCINTSIITPQKRLDVRPHVPFLPVLIAQDAVKNKKGWPFLGDDIIFFFSVLSLRCTQALCEVIYHGGQPCHLSMENNIVCTFEHVTGETALTFMMWWGNKQWEWSTGVNFLALCRCLDLFEPK